MPKIYELDSHVADLIAAGEVVERPASVVKELMENSIDAGAGIITVEITSGGMTYMRVTDNGGGIAPEDAKTAFLRHATSKLRGAEGLEAIGTLGFRGEALAAIAAVSRIELLTREPGAGQGVSLSLEAGEVRDMSPAGCPEGTTIIVRDLFFNTPARLKFMKSDRAESSAISSAVLRCALSRPEVSFRYIRDGKTEFHTPGDSRADSCIYSLFGREFAAGLVKADSSYESVTVTGYVSTPAAARGNRSYQFFFVNGRPVRSITLQAALEQAYRNSLPSGRFPSCALYITTGFGNVDVNVHPAKTEIKFVSDKQIFDGVYYAALGAIERVGALHAPVNSEFGIRNSEPGTRSSESTGDAGADAASSQLKVESGKWKVGEAGAGFKSMHVDEFRKSYNTGGHKHQTLANREPSVTAPSLLNRRYPGQPAESELSTNSEFLIPNSEFGTTTVLVLGEALGTYIIVQYRDSVWFIDKHAAHERIHFDALKTGGYEPMSQALMTPVICRLGHEGAAILLENAELLETLGFSVESFGDDAVAVRQIPADIDIGEAEPALSEICAELGRGGAAEPTRRDNIYRTVACKSAIKAGKSSGKHELEVLALRVMSGEISQCPHGRPVAYEVTKTMLDKSFKRI